jgi:peptidoglycan/LPS O-acetylase OafA/YrhL
VPWTYRPALDGLRSVAVYLVLLFHAGVAAVGGGFIGVDLFFVLSGFLVSNVILSEIDANGRLDLGRFYARRVRRLLPAAVLVVVATSAIFLLVTSVVRRLPLVLDAQSALLYVANWNFLFQHNDYFGGEAEQSPFLHFWSLSIEEQFYFVFPVVLLLLVRASRRRPWVLPVVLAGMFLMSLGSQLYWARVDVNWAYYGTDARLYQLLAGVLLALLLRSRPHVLPGRSAGGVAILGLAAMLLLGSGLLDLTPSVRGIGATVAAVMLVGALMVRDTGIVARLLSRRTPVYLGQISYGTYLWHWPVILVLGEVLMVRPGVLALLALAVSTALAALSFQILEMPVRTTELLSRFRWSTLLVGVTTSALVAVTVVPVMLESDRKPRLISAAAADPGRAGPVPLASDDDVTPQERNAPVPTDIDWEAMVSGGMAKPKCTPKDLRSCVVAEGDGPHITLVGDSHAGMLAPMFLELAEERGFTLSFNVIEACPWQAELVNRKRTAEQQKECRVNRKSWYASVLPRLDPDVVVLASTSRDDAEHWGEQLAREGGSDESVAELLFSTTTETVRLIESQGPRIVLIDSMPTAGDLDPLDCLAAAQRLNECEVVLPDVRPGTDAYNELAASRSEDIHTVDLTDVFCVGAPRCLPVVDDIVVWRDPNHFSREITLHRRDEVWRRLKATGVFRGL